MNCECVKMTKELYFADTLVSVKYNKTKKLPRAIFATQLSSRAVYFIQTGGSALNNTYSYYIGGNFHVINFVLKYFCCLE